jgi:O-antigen/teichoic acid export membrane protein
VTTGQSLGRRILTNTTFAFLDTTIIKVSTVAVFVLLARMLDKADVASIGVATGYLVLISYLDVAPIRVMLRDYPRLAGDRALRDRHLSALFLFWIFQAVTMLVVGAAIQLLLLSRLDLPALSFLFFALVIDFIALTFQDWLKLLFYADLRQAVATKVSFALTAGRLLAYGALAFWPSLTLYALILILAAVFNCAVWWNVFQRGFGFRPVFDGSSLGLLRQSLSSYGLWDHLNRTVIDTLFMIDTVILSWYVGSDEIGDYSIALRFTSLFFLVPMILHRSLQLTLSSYEEPAKRAVAVNSFFKLNLGIAVGQLAFVAILGSWLLHLLFAEKATPEVFLYALLISVGIAIMNTALPLLSIVNNFCNLRSVFVSLFLPALVAGLAIYVVAASNWGALGVAYGNIAVYTLMALGLAGYTVRHHPVSLTLPLVTPEERRLLTELWTGRP